MEPSTSGTDLFDLQVDQLSTSFLGETAKWAKFLAILGFVVSGVILLIALFAGSFLASTFAHMGGESGLVSGVFIGAIYGVVAVLAFFPCLYLYRFADNMQMALRANDQEQLNMAFRNMKSYFKFLGILAVIYLSFIVLGLIFGIISAAIR